MFAQETIKVEEVGRELAAVRDAIGSSVDVARFVPDALWRSGAVVTERAGRGPARPRARSPRRPRADRRPRRRGPRPGSSCRCPRACVYLNRTHPFVEGLAGYVMDTALDPLGRGRGPPVRRDPHRARSQRRTTLLLVRFRFHIVTADGRRARRRCWPRTARSSPSPARPRTPNGSTTTRPQPARRRARGERRRPSRPRDFVRKVVDGFDLLAPAPATRSPASAARSCSTPTAASARRRDAKGVQSAGRAASSRPTCSGSTSIFPKL